MERHFFGQYLGEAQRLAGLSEWDVAVNAEDSLGKSSAGARAWYRRLLDGARRRVTQRELRVLAEVLGRPFEEVRARAEEAGL